MKDEKIRATQAHAGVDHALRWDGGRQIFWVDSEGTLRIPEETHKKLPYPVPFLAAGKQYPNWQSLCAQETESGLCRDIYGREVFYMSERVPCFDSYDYAYEDRYYRWFFLRENGKLTRVYYADKQKTIEVTEDVAALENKCRKQLQEVGWIEKDPKEVK